MSAIVVLTTAPNLKFARSLAGFLVRKKLAACVSIRDGFSSYYRWKGKVENTREALLFIKTKKNNFDKVKTVIQRKHPYQLPEIISIPVIQGSSEYLSWLNQSLK